MAQSYINFGIRNAGNILAVDANYEKIQPEFSIYDPDTKDGPHEHWMCETVQEAMDTMHKAGLYLTNKGNWNYPIHDMNLDNGTIVRFTLDSVTHRVLGIDDC